jgi:hypothetical protein
MENLEFLISGLIAAIVTLTEFLKGLLAKFAPKLEISPRVLSWISAALVGAGAYFTIKPDSGGMLGALLFSFLASAGVYDHAIKPVKVIWQELKMIFTK